MGSPSPDDTSQKAIEGDLVETGEKLLGVPSSTDDLLLLLEKAESLLAKVWQRPPVSTCFSLLPAMKALVTDDLLHHNDLNVQVAVASCFNELTRITCPDPPYDDDVMMEFFRLFMTAFWQLTCGSGPNYSRAVLIIETMAKVRSFLMLLDIDNEGLIVEMFRIFLSNVKSSHPSGVFKYMEMIMTAVIEESDEILPELLIPLLASVKMETKNTSPISWELGKKVFENCSTKLRSYLREAVKEMNLVLSDYAVIVTSICLLISHDASNGKNKVSNKVTPNVGDRVFQLDGHSEDPRTNGRNGTQSGTDKGFLRKSRGRKPNSVIRPEEGYQHISALKGKYSDEISSDSFNDEKEDSYFLSEKGNVSYPSDLSKKKIKRSKVKESDYDHAPIKTDKGTVGEQSIFRVKKGKGILGGADKVHDSDMSPHGKQERMKIVSQKHVRRGDVDEGQVQMKASPSPTSKPAKAKSMKKDKEMKPRKPKVACGKELMNLRIKVWWPMDETFYPGYVTFFDPETKRHTILYDDGETEILNLRKEKWEVCADGKLLQNEEVDRTSPAAQQPVKILKKSTKRRTVSPKQLAALSPKRSKSVGICVENTQPEFSVSNSKDLDKEACESNAMPKDIDGDSHVGPQKSCPEGETKD